MKEKSKYVTILEAVRMLDISRQAIYLAIKKGAIRTERTYDNKQILLRSDVEKYRPIAKPKERAS